MQAPNSFSTELRSRGRRQRWLLPHLLGWLRANRKWWLAPIVAAMLFFGLLVLSSGSAAAPFLYTLF